MKIVILSHGDVEQQRLLNYLKIEKLQPIELKNMLVVFRSISLCSPHDSDHATDHAELQI
jgi:hypothetical protein